MEFELEGRTYRANKIDARTQFHIVRRLAPVLGEIAPALQGKGGLDALPPLANAVAKLTDSDADYVIFGLLKAVVRKQDQGLGWGPVATGVSIHAPRCRGAMHWPLYHQIAKAMFQSTLPVAGERCLSPITTESKRQKRPCCANRLPFERETSYLNQHPS